MDKKSMNKFDNKVDTKNSTFQSQESDSVELNGIVTYYNEKVLLHGESPLGVDWNGASSQRLRFEQLSKVFSEEQHFSIADLGCGYGALYTYLKEFFHDFSYYGYDISPEMLLSAQKLHANSKLVEFIESSSLLENVDFTIASGIFNVMQENSSSQWLEHIISTLDNMNQKSSKGFAFNCLTIFSDTPKMKPYLYYADPCFLFELCKKKYSRNVALLHDYDLYEFTIIVRK